MSAGPSLSDRAPSIIHASSAVRVSSPTVSNDFRSGMIPSKLHTPALGRCPTMPHNAAGSRTEPAVSVPTAATHMPAATAAAEPDDDPPVMRVTSHGFRAGPNAL